MPSSTASTSIVALSVSISAITSPDFDLIAFLDQPLGEVALFHGRREGGHGDVDGHDLPSPLLVADGFDGIDDFADIRQSQLFEVRDRASARPCRRWSAPARRDSRTPRG